MRRRISRWALRHYWNGWERVQHDGEKAGLKSTIGWLLIHKLGFTWEDEERSWA